MKKKLVVLFGGKSVESDISVITAMQTLQNLDKAFDALPIYIDKCGIWWIGDNLDKVQTFENFEKNAKNKKQVTLAIGERILYEKKRNKFVANCEVDCVLNCCHGGGGEGGAIQGYLSECALAQTSPLQTSSALCMDKCFMKDIFKSNDITSPQYVCIKKDDFDGDLKTITSKIKFPLIVKPANLGSSIGIKVCKNEKELQNALDFAFEFDNKILIEKLVENLKEFNCACFKYRDMLYFSNVCEVTGKGEIYSFEDKYLSSAAKNKIADKKLSSKIKILTEKIYKLFDCKGVVRVDFLYDDKNKILYANEINTIPGSLSFYMFKGTTFKDLLTALIEEAKLDFDKQKSLVKSFKSDAVKIFAETKIIKK